MEELTVDKDGRLTLPPRVVRSVGSRPLDLATFSDRHLLFTLPGEGSVTLAGRLGDFAVADILSFLNMFRQNGVLRFSLEGGEKELFFQQGEVVFADSTFPEEELGETLYSLGKIDRDALTRARGMVGRSGALDKVLVDRDFVPSKDLWLATRHRAESIVYHLFGFQQGGFVFIARDLEDEEIVRLPMSTQNLIMEGLRRVDERALFMRRIESLDRIALPAKEPPEDLPAAAQRLLKLLRSGRLSVREVIRQSAMGEFEGLRLLHQLVEKKIVSLEDAPDLAPSGVCGEILAIYNGALAALHQAVSEKYPDFNREIRLFLRDLPQPFSYVLRDAVLEENGTFAGGGILANLAGLEEGDKEKLLADALNELIFMECIIARRELGTTGSAELVQRVQKIASRIKELVGRQE